MDIFGPENSQTCNIIYLTGITKHLELDSISIMLVYPLLYVTQQISNTYSTEIHQMFCQTRSKVALVEFLCLIFNLRGALVLTLSLCANMWNQQFPLIQGRMFRVLPPRRLSEKFRNFARTLCQPVSERLIPAYCSFMKKYCVFGQEGKTLFYFVGALKQDKTG